MKKYIFPTFLLLLIIIAGFTFWNKIQSDSKLNNSEKYYQELSDELNRHRNNKPFTLNIKSEGGLGETNTLKIKQDNNPVLSYSFQKCIIHINDKIIGEKKLSKDTVAFIIGHEMGHCEIADKNPNASSLLLPKEKHQIELQSDSIGLLLAIKSGYNKRIIIDETDLYLNKSDSHSHPDRVKRIIEMEKIQWKP